MMSSAELKDELEARRARIRNNFDDITDLADDVRDAYPPFVTKLEDIQRALKLDLTPAGIQSIKPSLDSAKEQGDVLAKKLDKLGVEIDALQGKLAPTPAPQASETK